MSRVRRTPRRTRTVGGADVRDDSGRAPARDRRGSAGERSLWESLDPHVSGAYANFLAGATDEDVAAVYPTETYQRLAAVKDGYDPHNLFSGNHNIRPS